MTLTHFDQSGHAHMVDIGNKQSTQRKAVAEGCITMLPTTLAMVRSGSSTKGDVLGIARIAAIQAAKRTSELIPLCHLLLLTRVTVDFTESIYPHAIRCCATVECQSQTGVEMEALTAVNVGLLAIYDMCKSVDRGMKITDIQLLEKSGGRSGHWQREVPAIKS